MHIPLFFEYLFILPRYSLLQSTMSKIEFHVAGFSLFCMFGFPGSKNFCFQRNKKQLEIQLEPGGVPVVPEISN